MHKNYNAPSKILDKYSKLARSKTIKTRASRVNAIFENYSTRLARNFFFKIKFLSSESSRVKFKNGIHSTRSSFHCFVSSKFRVLVKYFWRRIVIFVHLQKMFFLLNGRKLNALLITNNFYKKEKLLENKKDLAKQKLWSKPAKTAETTESVEAAVQKYVTQNCQNIPRSSRQNDKSKTAKPPIWTWILGIFDILQFEIFCWIFFLVWTGKKIQFEVVKISSLFSN